MTSFFVPLREVLIDGLVPPALFTLPDDGAQDAIGLTSYRVRATPAGVHVSADLGTDPAVGAAPPLVVGLPAFPDLALVLRAPGRVEAWIGDDFALRLSLGAFSLRLPPSLLRPVRAAAAGGWEADADREAVEVEFTCEPDDATVSPYPFVLTVDGRGRVDLDLAFLDPAGPLQRPRASLNGRAMVADTGVVIDVQGISFDLDPADPWLALDMAEVILPETLTGPLLLPRIELTDARLGRRGVSGSATATWPLALAAGAFVYHLDDGPREAQLFGLEGGLRAIAVSLEDNRVVAFEASGGLIVPYFDEPVEVRLDIQPSGDFAVTLLAADADGLILRKEEALALTITSLSLARRDDVAEVMVSGGVEPLLRASEGLVWPRLDVTDLAIDTAGRFRVREAWLDLKDLATLDLFGFHFELNRIGLGTEEARDRLWIDLSGSLRLIEHIPVGLGVEGFRISWPRDLDEIVAVSTPPTLDEALAILGAIEVQFDGIHLFFGVPDAVEFEGLIRFIKTDEVVGFAGDVALRVPASGFAAEAGLMVGMNFEPPPYPFLYVYFGVELPAGIPLGQSGLALKGALGLFGLNVSPARAPDENWYYDWYRRPPIVGAHPTNKWRPERAALSFGAGVTITTADGYLKGTRGLVVFSLPGPILILEGRALLLSGLGPGEPPLRALAVFDGKAQTVQFNVEASAVLVEDMLEAAGGLEAFFDFKDLTNWHVYLGQDTPEDRRIAARVFRLPEGERYLFDASGYYMADMVGAGSLRSRMGMFVGLEQTAEFDPVTVALDAWIEGAGEVTVRPEQFSGALALGAKVEISTFGFGLQLGAEAAVLGEGPDPFRVEATVSVSADLPDPLEDLETEFHFEWQSPPALTPSSPLVGTMADSDLLPQGGALALHGTTLHQVDGDIATRLEAGEGRLDAVAARREAEAAPVVALDARPTLLFSHDMNDLSAGHFARDSDGRESSHDIGRLRLRPTLREVTLFKHPRAEPWTGDAGLDWELVASSSPALAGDAARLWGIWLADAGSDDPGAPAARRLRLWTLNPFVYARDALGTGYPRILGFEGPRTSYADEFLDGFPSFLECRGTEPTEACFDFAGLPVPPKDDRGAGPFFARQGVTFTGATRLEPHGDGGPGVCLVTSGALRMEFAEPAAQVRITFCRDPQLPAPAARDRIRASRAGIELSAEVRVEGLEWIVAAPQAFDRLDLTRPQPLERVCTVTGVERARAHRAAAQCERNDEALAHAGDRPPVLAPGTYYRLVVTTAVEAELRPAPDSSPFAAALDALYEEALESLTGATASGMTGFVQEAFFTTEGPPRALAPYIGWSSPEPQATRVFRDDDLLVRFRRSTLRAMFGAAPHRLEIVVRDAEGRPAPGYETAWSEAPSATLLPDEARWLAHVGEAPGPAPDDIVEARRRCLVADDFADPRLPGWEVLAVGGAPSPWRVLGGELGCVSALFEGSAARGDPAKRGPMIVADSRALRASGTPRPLVFAVDLRSVRGEAIGAVVAYAGPDRYYRFSMDDTQRYRRLVKVAGGAVAVLFETREGFERADPHAIEIAWGFEAAHRLRLRITVDGRAWCDVVDDDRPLGSERVGLYCWRNAHARFLRVRVRAAAEATLALAPAARHELAVVDTADGAVLHRVPFVTSAYRRFRDLVLSFAGQARDLPPHTPPAGIHQTVDAARNAMAAYADATRAWQRGVIRHRNQGLDRAGLEGLKLAQREARAALDAAYHMLADDLGLPLFEAAPAALEVWSLRSTARAVLGFWLRSPETLDPRFAGAGADAGRTALALQHRRSDGQPWSEVALTAVSNADGLQILLWPEAAGPWPAGSYRAVFTYRRTHADEADADARPFARPFQRHLGSDAPEHAAVGWRVR